MKVVFLICFTLISILACSQSKFIENYYIAGITPNEILNQLNDIDFDFWGVEEIKVSSDFVKDHKIKSITEKKYKILKNKKEKPYDKTYKKTYFNRNGLPTKIENNKFEKSIDRFYEFEYDENDNLITFCAYNNFWKINHENLVTEVIIENEFNNNLLVHQNIRCVYSTYKFNKRLIDSKEISYFHNISYSLNDSISVVTVNADFDTLLRKAHVNLLYPYQSEVNCNNHYLSAKNKDTLLCKFFTESEMWSIKTVSNKEYDSLDYLIKMDAVIYKKNTLENYDTLLYYTRKSLDTLDIVCPYLWYEVSTKGTKPGLNPDSIRYRPEYTLDTINVQYQFYYMDAFNYSSTAKMVQGYILFNENGEKIDQYERNSKQCVNFYNKNGLIDKQVFTLSPFWVEPKDQEWNYVPWDSDYVIRYEFEYF